MFPAPLSDSHMQTDGMGNLSQYLMSMTSIQLRFPTSTLP